MSRSRLTAFWISFLSSLPLISLKLIYINNFSAWISTLAYGLPFFMAGIILIFLVFMGVEIVLRSRRMKGFQLFPWFTPVVLCSLVMFLFVGEWFKPVVLQNPNWCRVNQTIKWNVSLNKYFVLVLVGQGNVKNHRFSTGWLNWSGDELAGIPTIEFNPIRFGRLEIFEENGSFELLQQRIKAAVSTKEKLDSLATDIWRVLQQADRGVNVTSTIAIVHPIWEGPLGDEHVEVGGIVWMFVVFILFQVIGQLTLVEQKQRNLSERIPR